ncbi:hypothetical protein BAUCODRAFT_79558 [Baudoinia panamericana UAMH 10762]|uniref:Box C/D snoRNA protein 1 n=1 Tax=Baudoinia panamericana (strain UAMH 10762) TaxID=717646 RepID=M2M5J3_BAUPA|nr:uncharacterized protein BAUCODRAFT_79558 [Baudoinia panamericana UAMH 10762]EMC91896.1 hypothetical protein BAUCODRAFT_79558 [Baudoinia panamericana UAMH 10762]
MADHAMLSELCSVCYTEKPKYRCPRCSIQTCSLPCYKKHQQRASCNGKRDPAAYLRKSQWATPTGLDLDFNYLKNIENRITSAGHYVQDRGIESGHASHPTATGNRFQQYLDKYNITVRRAPKGMSRERANTSRATKGHDALWSVEWILGAEQRNLLHDCAESDTIASLYKSLVMSEARKRGENAQSQRSKKRKRAQASEASSQPQASSSNAQPRNGDFENTSGVTEACDEPATERKLLEDLNETAPTTRPDVSGGAGESKHVADDLHFYLLKPGSSSGIRALIPLQSADTLTRCLTNRTVLEYPTIYVMPDRPDSLPEGFIQDDDDWTMPKTERYAAEGDAHSNGMTGSKGKLRVDGKDSTVDYADAQSILDMLKRDVSA